MKLPPDVDDECVELCEAINLYAPDIFTIESCCGHDKRPYHIWFKVNDLEILPHILYWMDGCHTGYYKWKVEVSTDCAKQYPTFVIEGPVGAYDQAEFIACLIREDFKLIHRKMPVTHRLRRFIHREVERCRYGWMK